MAASEDLKINKPAGRRLMWESWADIRAVNTYLLVYAICTSIAVALLSVVLVTIFTRPPFILSQDEGVVMWRSTEAFRLRSDMVRQFLGTTLGTIFNVTPSNYDLTPITSYVDPRLMDMLTGKGRETQSSRLSNNERKTFNILETKRMASSRFPKLIATISRADETITSDSRDQAGNVITSSKSSIVFVVTYMEQIVPTPSDPFGLYVMGIDIGNNDSMLQSWNEAIPLEESTDKRGHKLK